MKRMLLSLFLAATGILTHDTHAREIFREKIVVRKVSGFDPANGFDHPAWETAQSGAMLCFITVPEELRRLPKEGGRIRLLYDENYLYVRGDLTDSEIRNTGENDTHLYATGDVLEVFLKPLHDSDYWEIYGTPNGKHTAFHYPARGCLGLPSASRPRRIGVKVYPKIDGTLNVSGDRDRSWSVIIAIPRAALEREGASMGRGGEWTIMTARYNHGASPDQLELSCFAQVADHFHAAEYYALLEFTE